MRGVPVSRRLPSANACKSRSKLPPLYFFNYFISVGRSPFLKIKSEQQEINLVWPHGDFLGRLPLYVCIFCFKDGFIATKLSVWTKMALLAWILSDFCKWICHFYGIYFSVSFHFYLLKNSHLSRNRISYLAGDVFQAIPRVEYLWASCTNKNLATWLFVCKFTHVRAFLTRILTENQIDNMDARPLRSLPRLFQLWAKMGVLIGVTKLYQLCVVMPTSLSSPRALFRNSIQRLPKDSLFGTENIVYL